MLIMHRFYWGKSVIWGMNKVQKQELTLAQQELNFQVEFFTAKSSGIPDSNQSHYFG